MYYFYFFSVLFVSCVSVKAPVSVTNQEIGSKTGEATGMVILGLFGDVDAGIVQAAKNGGITKISTVEFTVNPICLGIVTNFTCTVTGE